MIQKCDGIKILDLDSKEQFSGAEYTVIAEKGTNYKIPLDSIGDTIINSSKFKAKVENAYLSSTPVAHVELKDNEFKFRFGIPAGEKGDPGIGRDGKDGKDGKDGIDGVPGIDGDTIRNVIAYKSTSTTVTPDTPVGGSWDAVTNTVTYPEGWSGSDANPNGYVWMSTSSFSSKGTQVDPWSTPVRLTGENGKDGSDGTSIEFIYKLTVTNLDAPVRPYNDPNTTDYVPDGWTDSPSGITEQYQCEWVCSRTLAKGGTYWEDWEGPTIWSKWGVNGKDGDGVEYIYQRTKLPAPPHDITDNNPSKDEHIPTSYPGEEDWTDNPSGVSSAFPYEWVSKRKYKGTTHTWSNFSTPALWASNSGDGSNGQDGMSLRVMYTATSGSGVKPTSLNRLNINPGSIWGTGMPTVTGTQAIWGIQALVTYDNQLYIDYDLPADERGWQGPYLITGVPGLDGNNFNFNIDVYKLSSSQPQPPTGNDPYNPGNGWISVPDTSTGTWWKCTALVNGLTTMVIEWGAVVKVTGSSINILGTLDSVDDLPTSGNQIGDGYIIDGDLWVWNGTEWVNAGKIQGADGNYVEYRFARNNSWETAPTLSKTSRYPSGWSNSAPALSTGKVLWATFATINGTDDTLITNWADPYYMTGISGDNGSSGIPGVGYEIRYCKGTETSYTGEQWSDSMKRKRVPTGWSLDVPDITTDTTYNYIWFIQVRVIDDALEANQYWSKPQPMGGIITPDPVGKTPIAYPAGIYSTGTPYKNDGEKAPYVYDTGDGNYYFLKAVMTWLGTQQNNKTPSTDTSGAWTKLENYEAIYADLLIAPNSLVGGAVFNNNLMFSQRGKNASDAEVSNYLDINVSDPMNKANSFRPNMLMDFATGNAYFGAGGIHLAADGNSSIELKSGNQSVSLDPDKLAFSGSAGVTSYIKGTGEVNLNKKLKINVDGSGSLGNSLEWDADGNAKFSGEVTIDKLNLDEPATARVNTVGGELVWVCPSSPEYVINVVICTSSLSKIYLPDPAAAGTLSPWLGKMIYINNSDPRGTSSTLQVGNNPDRLLPSHHVMLLMLTSHTSVQDVWYVIAGPHAGDEIFQNAYNRL